MDRRPLAGADVDAGVQPAPALTVPLTGQIMLPLPRLIGRSPAYCPCAAASWLAIFCDAASRPWT
jgi:hypothetical protein